METPCLFLPNVESRQKFESHQEDVFKRELQLEALNTSFVSGSADGLSLDNEGKTRDGGFRYTQSSFGDLCDRLMPHLFIVLCHMSGAVQARDTKAKYSLLDAIHTFNRLLKLREESVKPLVIEKQFDKITAIYRNAQRLIPERELVLEGLLSAFPDMGFVEAQLTDNELLIRMLSKTPNILNIEGFQHYYTGISVFFERKPGGRLTAAGLTAINSNLFSSGKWNTFEYKGWKRKNFPEKYSNWLKDPFINGSIPSNDLIRRLDAIKSEKLVIKNHSPSDVHNRLLLFLQRLGIKPTKGAKIIRSIFANNLPAVKNNNQLMRWYMDKSVFDLYIGLMKIAKEEESLHGVIALETIAHNLLIGDVRY